MPILQRKERVSDEIPTASLADIAFLLLIFFLVTTVFDEEMGLPIVLPEPDAEEEVAEDNLLFLMVQPDARVVVRHGAAEAERTVSHRQVEGIVRQELAANPNLIVAVQTHPDAAYRHMVDVLDQVKLADARRISLQMRE